MSVFEFSTHCFLLVRINRFRFICQLPLALKLINHQRKLNHQRYGAIDVKLNVRITERLTDPPKFR